MPVVITKTPKTPSKVSLYYVLLLLFLHTTSYFSTCFSFLFPSPRMLSPRLSYMTTLNSASGEVDGENLLSHICQIRAHNFAGMASQNEREIILNLTPHMIAVTGESGSGKSLLFNKAVNFVLGGKCSANYILRQDDTSTESFEQEARVDLVIKLVQPQLGKVMELLGAVGIDPNSLFSSDPANREEGVILFSRKIILKTGKSRIQSTCSINGKTLPLRTITQIGSSILRIVDAPMASSALSKSDARMAIIDQAISPSLINHVVSCANEYKKKRKDREKLELELSRRVLPASFPDKSPVDGTKSDVDDNFHELLQHWVSEMDDFELKIQQLQEKSSRIVLKIKDQVSSSSVSNEEVKQKYVKVSRDYHSVSLYQAAKTFSTLEWNIQYNDKDHTDGPSFYDSLLDFRNALKSLDCQLENARSAYNVLATLSSTESAITAIGRARGHLLDVTNNNDDSDAISQATERSHQLLNSVEQALDACVESIDGHMGLIETIEDLMETIQLSCEDIDMFIADWNSLARKHGISPYHLQDCHHTLKLELDGNVEAREKLPTIKKAESQALHNLEDACRELTDERIKVCNLLSTGVTENLPSLGMSGFKFVAVVEDNKRDCVSPTVYKCEKLGVDSVDFLLIDQNRRSKNDSSSPNCDEYHGRVEEIASSGERARILLAIETVIPGSIAASCNKRSTAPSLGSSPNVPVAILYDEIDAHVGGRAAVAIAKLLAKQCVEGKQVICVTHSGPVAAIADRHIVVQKMSSHESLLQSGGYDDMHQTKAGKLYLNVHEVDGLARKKELARMSSGDLAPAEAIIFADALLREGVEHRTSQI